MSFAASLDTRLLQLSPTDYFTTRDAVQGVAVFGGIGAGKTSGTGKALASAYLRAGFGGIVLAAKPDEVELWQHYARDNGRASSLILFGEKGGGGFNFIDYELKRQGIAGLSSVIECIMRILEADRLVRPNSAKSSEPFWENSPRQLLRNTVPVIYAANGRVTLEEIYRFISTAPKSRADLDSPAWQGQSFMFEMFTRAVEAPKVAIDADEIETIHRFWGEQFAALDDKTRGNIVLNLTTVLDRFLRGRLRDHFCRDTTLVPEMTFHGAIIILAMPALSWNEDGILAQHLFKFMWQRAVLARNSLPEPHRTRPVFLWADEAQYFVNSYDREYQSTCRSARGCTVYLSQSLPTYYAVLGDHVKSQADSILGNFGTKVWHSNADPVTNRWASETIGRVKQYRRSYSKGTSSGTSTSIGTSTGESSSRSQGSNSSHQNSGASYGSNSSSGSSSNIGRNRSRGRNIGESESESVQEVVDFELEPAFFARDLATGGPRRIVEAVWFQSSRSFEESGGRNYLHVRFRQ